ncbi:MAG: 4Fe-4S dicluster domain-containing protein [Vicinamibacterales bacterium]|nr:4Fe-4S dicluster domain-containing protein [Vicinamibacterales bacterium]
MQDPTNHCRYAEDVNPAFPADIMARPGGEALRDCIQCGTCSGACPMSVYMDLTPRRIIALTRAGLERDVLQSGTPWLCASCYECQVRCPRGVKVTDIMYALKRRAIDKGQYPKRFPIPVLARAFHNMVATRGRNSESWLVVELMLKTNPLGLLKMAPLGLKLIATGRMVFTREKIHHVRQLKKVLDAVEES